MKDIENMDRVQHLTTTLAWLRCGKIACLNVFILLFFLMLTNHRQQRSRLFLFGIG